MRTLAMDIETYSSGDLAKAGVYAYTSFPDFEILLFAYAYDDDIYDGENNVVHLVDLAQGEKIPEQVLHDLEDQGVIKTAFNAQFERVCLSFGAAAVGTLQRERVCTIEIWCECFGREAASLKKGDAYELNAIMAKIKGWEKYEGNKRGNIRFPIYGIQRGYQRKVNI